MGCSLWHVRNWTTQQEVSSWLASKASPVFTATMAPHSSTLAWKIPWMEEPGRLQTMGSRRVRHDWATSLSLFPFMHWRRKWQPTPVFLPGESQGRGSLVAAIYGVSQSWTRLKRLSSSSSSPISPVTTWALPPVRLVVALDCHRNTNPIVNYCVKGIK